MNLTKTIRSEYTTLEESTHQKVKRKESYTIKNLVNLAQEWFCLSHNAGSYFTMYQQALEKIKKFSYTNEDITELCFHAEDFKKYDSLLEKQRGPTFDRGTGERYIGIFLSALIFADQEQTKTKKEYIIFTEEFQTKLFQLGMRNTRAHIIIQGNVGDSLGRQMEGGTIIVYGNTEDNAGKEMTNGEIVIQGNTGALLGCEMKGGSIHLEKNAGNSIGNSMSGGKIFINGNIGEIASTQYLPETKKGEIYHKGEKVKLPFP